MARVYAAERGLFLMEAMWTVFAPAIIDLRQRIRDGGVGEAEEGAKPPAGTIEGGEAGAANP